MISKLKTLLNTRANKSIAQKINNYSLAKGSIFSGRIIIAPWVSPETLTLLVGEGCIIRCDVNFVKDHGELIVGRNSFINAGTSLVIAAGMEIGDDVLISYDCVIMDNDGHSLDSNIRQKDLSRLRCGIKKEWTDIGLGKITIGSNSWIGVGAKIFKNVCVGNGAVIAGGAVVTRNIAPCVVAGGNPAKVIKKIDHC